jgi:hypothetical protein
MESGGVPEKSSHDIKPRSHGAFLFSSLAQWRFDFRRPPTDTLFFDTLSILYPYPIYTLS